MECKKCGALVPNDGKYCPSCGIRADGKKTCPACAKEVCETDTFCTYCGERVDGKKVCARCGTIIESEFCPTCGAKKSPSVAKKPSKQIKERKFSQTFEKVEKWVSPSLLLGSLLVLFICSFFVGAYVKLGNYKESCCGFYFFGDAFKEIDDYVNTININPQNLETFKSTLNLPYVFSAIFVGVNIAVSFAMLLIASLKYAFSIKNKNNININLYATISFVSFLITAVYVLSLATMTLSTAGIETLEYGMSAGSNTGIIIALICILSVFVLKQIKKGKEVISVDNIKKTIPIVVLFIMAYILVLSASSFLNLRATTESIDITSNVSAISYMMVAASSILMVNQVTIIKANMINSVLRSSNLGLFGFLALICSIGLLIFIVLNILTSDKAKKALLILIFSSVTAMISIVQFIFSIIANNSYSTLINTVGSASSSSINTVGTLILGLIVLGIGITYFIFNVKKKEIYFESEIIEE